MSLRRYEHLAPTTFNRTRAADAVISMMRHDAQQGRRAFGIMSVLAAAVFGAVASYHVTAPTVRIVGMCIALDMAAAHGAVNKLQQRRILRSIASVANPQFDRFPVTYRRLSEYCAMMRQPTSVSMTAQE